MTRSFEDLLRRKQQEYGEQFDASKLDRRFVPYYENGERIRIDSFGEVGTDTVGVTTGWKPAFLLIRTSRSLGSSWVLGDKDRIVAVKRGRKYCGA